MSREETRLDHSVPIQVLGLFRPLTRALLDLLHSFDDKDWALPTCHEHRDVKDLTAHLIHGSLRRVSLQRDDYQPPIPCISGREELTDFIQADNRKFMSGMRRVSPEILIELIERYDEEMAALFHKQDPAAPGLGVAWAGEQASPNWFDIAREYTEKWHHQQQLRDATKRPHLYKPSLFAPVLETFARGLPFAYRLHEAEERALLRIEVTGYVELSWTLRRVGKEWRLIAGPNREVGTTISLPAEIAWKLWTKSIERDAAGQHMQVRGDKAAAAPLLHFVSIMA